MTQGMQGLENIKQLRWVKGSAKPAWTAKALAERLGVKTLKVTQGRIEVGEDPSGNALFQDGIEIEFIGEPNAVALDELDREFEAWEMRRKPKGS